MLLNPCFVKRVIYGKTILMPVIKNRIADSPIALNETAALIISEITKSRNETENRRRLKELFEKEYGLDSQKNVDGFIDYLLSQEIIVREEDFDV